MSRHLNARSKLLKHHNSNKNKQNKLHYAEESPLQVKNGQTEANQVPSRSFECTMYALTGVTCPPFSLMTTSRPETFEQDATWPAPVSSEHSVKNNAKTPRNDEPKTANRFPTYKHPEDPRLAWPALTRDVIS